MTANDASLSPHRSTVATLLTIEATLVLTLGAWLLVLGLVHEKREMAPLLGVIAFAVVGSLGLFGCARGYKSGKNYGRSPTILANLIALGVAYYQVQGHFYIGAIIIVALALPTLFFAFAVINHENP